MCHNGAFRARVSRVLRDSSGGVAAEFAVTLPAVLLVLACAIGVLHAGAQRVVLQDVAADAARLIGRGETPMRADASVQTSVPAAALEVLDTESDLVCVRVSAHVAVLGGFEVPMSARSCALGGGL